MQMNWMFLLISFMVSSIMMLLLLKFFKHANNFLMILLILEFFMLSNLTFFLVLSNSYNISSSFFLGFLTFSVCEASVGLGLLIKFTRLKGVSNILME